MKPIFYLNEYRTATFYATNTRLSRLLHCFNPPLIYDPDTYTKSLCFSSINSLQQTFGSVSFTIVLPIFCVRSSGKGNAFLPNSYQHLKQFLAIFCSSAFLKPILAYNHLPNSSSVKTILKIQLLNHFKKNP